MSPDLPLTGCRCQQGVSRTPKASWPQQALIVLLCGYKRFLSPLLPPACRFVPTCSQYALEAVEKYGVFRGLLLAAWRLLRCHPFSKGGYDPVR